MEKTQVFQINSIAIVFQDWDGYLLFEIEMLYVYIDSKMFNTSNRKLILLLFPTQIQQHHYHHTHTQRENYI